MQVFFMIDRHFVSSVLLGLVAGMLAPLPTLLVIVI